MVIALVRGWLIARHIVDTSDIIFVSSLTAGTNAGCGGIGCVNGVPEPGSLALVGLALAAAAGFGVRRRN